MLKIHACAGGEVVVVLVLSIFCVFVRRVSCPTKDGPFWRPARGPLHGNLGGQRRTHEPQSPPVRRQWISPVEKDQEEVQVAARHQVECVENAPLALGETESTVAKGLNAIERSSLCSTRSSFGCAIDSFHSPFSEPSSTDKEERVMEQKALDGALARLSSCAKRWRDIQMFHPRGESSGDTTGTNSCRSSFNKGPPIKSEIGSWNAMLLAKKRALSLSVLLPMLFRRTRASTCWGIIRLWTVDQQ